MGRHLSLGKELKPSYKKLLSHKFVKNISRQYCSVCRHRYRPGTIRYKMDIPSGIKVTGYDGSGCVNMYIYIQPIDKAAEVKEFIKVHLSEGR